MKTRIYQSVKLIQNLIYKLTLFQIEVKCLAHYYFVLHTVMKTPFLKRTNAMNIHNAVPHKFIARYSPWVW